MGASVGTSGQYNDEPNVVPMIDVLLVLLIIFMMQIPLQRRVMEVQLPPEEKVQANDDNTAQSNQIVLELKDDGTYAINSEPIALSMLDAKIHEIYDNRPNKLMFVKTARNRKYREVVEVMDVARGAGVQVIGFTPPEENAETSGA